MIVHARLVNLIVFGLASTGFAAALLAALPNFRADRRQFSGRFLYFLWRYCLPLLGFEEIVLRLFFGTFYP
jgi:hypothetical protein